MLQPSVNTLFSMNLIHIMNPEAEQRAALRRHLGLDKSVPDMSGAENLKSKPSPWAHLRSKSNSKPITMAPCSSKGPSGVSFFIERCPPSIKPEKCSLVGCTRPFQSGHYRVAVTPAMSNHARQNADLYHIACLEKIADFSQPAFISCIEPFTRLTGSFQSDGNYLCAGAVERLVLEWKSRRMRFSAMVKTKSKDGELEASGDKNLNIKDTNDVDIESYMDETENENEESYDEDDDDVDEDDDDDESDEGYDDELRKRILNLINLPNNQHLIYSLFYDLWHNAGSSRFNSYGPIPGMQQYEYYTLLTLLAPWESEGPGDNEEWNVFDVFLGKEEGDQEIVHEKKTADLSAVLSKWERWADLALSPEISLSPEQLDEKKRIGVKGCRAIKRLAVIPLPQTAWNF